ncbi:MAG: glycoside hydrolase family 31 protein [Agriterribacter sp.]
MPYLKNCFTGLIFVVFLNNTFAQTSANIFTLNNSEKMQIDIFTNGIFRVQMNKNGVFNNSLMERYELINSQLSREQMNATQNDSSYVLETPIYRLLLNKQNGNVTVYQKNGNLLKRIKFNHLTGNQLQQFTTSVQTAFGDLAKHDAIIGDTAKDISRNTAGIAQEITKESLIDFDLQPNERFYGAGAASRKNIQHRGELLRIWATYQVSDMVTPFIMSTNGWGIYNNTTRINYFDVGKFSPNDLLIYNTEDKIDFFLFLGNNMYDIIDKYTLVTGRPYLLPTWAYGLAFGGNTMENQIDMMNDAVRFREEKVPCDIFWIEPQWMAKYYDTSTSKSWNQKKFPGEVFWEEKNNKKKYEQPYLFIGRLHKLGFKLALWLCIDHDLSVEAEDEIAKKQGRTLSGKEHWFRHLMKFVDQGVDGFKLDPGRTLDEHPDRKYYNGLTDKEMHNVNQVLMPKQMYTTFRNHTGRRSFHHYCGAYAGTQRWAASTSGDNGGGRDALYDQLNLGISGFVNTSADVLEVTNRTFDPETNMKLSFNGMHLGFFLPWVQINSWYGLHHPWYFSPVEKEAITFYAQLRNMLHPYIYSAAIEGSRTGKPMLRAMPLEYPNDTAVQNMVYQYMFGENFLVGVFNDSVYLPKGNWINYWTGKTTTGGKTVHAEVPKNRGGALFIKAGAIIPFKKLSQYVEEFPVDTLTIKVYPEGASSYTLLQDDGISFDYEKGSIASTTFTCAQKGNNINFSVSPTKGTYKNMPGNIVYKIEMAVKQKPKQVKLNNKLFSQWKWSNGVMTLNIGGNTTELKLEILH